MSEHSLELTIDAQKLAAKAFRAVKRFDSTVVMGTALQRMRERKPFDMILPKTFVPSHCWRWNAITSATALRPSSQITTR